jgi:enterochelin esterase family protein
MGSMIRRKIDQRVGDHWPQPHAAIRNLGMKIGLHFFRFIPLFITLAIASSAAAQQPPASHFERAPIFDSYATFRSELFRIVDLADRTARQAELDAFWARLLDANQVPYVHDEQVAFLYRSPTNCQSVTWPNVANKWDPSDHDWQGTRLGDTNLYMLEKTFPNDSRVDYKISVDGEWKLDPANPLQAWSGFGPNSELRMPHYVFPQQTVYRDDIDHGSLSDNRRIASKELGYEVQYRVYTPANMPATGKLPSVYFTDGHEYLEDYLGAAINVLDNLIAQRRLRPVVVVFVDPRDINDLAINRRMEQYKSNPKFAAFVANELVPRIDNDYPTRRSADERVLIGTSLGGLNAAYLGATHSEVFRRLGIQSPAFWVDPSIYDKFRNRELAENLRIYMTMGTFQDDGGATRMEEILSSLGYDFTFVSVHDGHSWGGWRAQLDEILIGLLDPPRPKTYYPVGWIVGIMLCGGIVLSVGRRRLMSWV